MPPLRAESFKAAAELSAVGLPSSRCGEVCDNLKYDLCKFYFTIRVVNSGILYQYIIYNLCAEIQETGS